MAIKTFISGQVLTAADTNTYLANAGLVFVASGSLSGSTKDFPLCFSDTYDNYLILIDQISVSASGDIYFQMLSGSTPATTAEYFWAYRGLRDDGVASDNVNAGMTQGYTGFSSTLANLVLGSIQMTVYGPKIAQRTFIKSLAIAYPTTSATRDGMARHNVTTAYDGIRFTTGGTVTFSGNVTIYGYRKA